MGVISMANEELPSDIRQKMAQKSIFFTLICCQLDEVDAEKVLTSASVQYLNWKNLPPEARLAQFKKEIQED